MKKTIEIKCSASATIAMSELVNYQGNLKKLSKKNLEKLKGSILKHGFVAPVFIWFDNGINKIQDGNQRLAVLLSLQEDGYEIPPIPVDYIHAENEEEAKAILLSISSSYGQFNTEELNEWLDQIDDDTKELLRLVDEEIKIEKPKKEKKEKEQAYCPHCGEAID